jgi:hypothetical protein
MGLFLLRGKHQKKTKKNKKKLKKNQKLGGVLEVTANLLKRKNNREQAQRPRRPADFDKESARTDPGTRTTGANAEGGHQPEPPRPAERRTATPAAREATRYHEGQRNTRQDLDDVRPVGRQTTTRKAGPANEREGRHQPDEKSKKVYLLFSAVCYDRRGAASR